MTLLQRNQYSLSKTNHKNLTTGATTSAQLLTTPSSPHSGKPRRGVAFMYSNAPYFVVIGGTPIRIHNAHTLWCGNEGQNQLMCCCQCTGFLTQPSLNMEKEEHSRNLLDDLTSLKARRLGRREDIKQLDCSKHVDETRD
jgi:hypothetical protein